MKIYITVNAITHLLETQACIEALSRMDDIDNAYFNILYSDNCPSKYAISGKDFEDKVMPLAQFPHMQFKKIDGIPLATTACNAELKNYVNNIKGYDLYQWLESDILMNPDWKYHIDKLHTDLSPKYKLGMTSSLNIHGSTSRKYKKRHLEDGYVAQKYISGNTFVFNNDTARFVASLDGSFWECNWEQRIGYELTGRGSIHVCTLQSHGLHVGISGFSIDMKRWQVYRSYDNFIPDPKIKDIHDRLNLPRGKRRF